MKKIDSGSWNAGTTLSERGGQGMKFSVRNTNVLGTTLTITSDHDGSQAKIIPPFTTVDFEFSFFSPEPVRWNFDISTNSDAFIVTWDLYSTWAPGDPPNPLVTEEAITT